MEMVDVHIPVWQKYYAHIDVILMLKRELVIIEYSHMTWARNMP